MTSPGIGIGSEKWRARINADKIHVCVIGEEVKKKPGGDTRGIDDI